MPRKEILYLIKNSSVGIGEFYENDVIWGGTGWEVLSQGIPLIQGFKKKKINSKTNMAMTPLRYSQQIL